MKRTVYLIVVGALCVGLVCSVVWAAKGGNSGKTGGGGPKSGGGVTVTTVDASGSGKTVPMPGVTVELWVANGALVTTGVTGDNAQVQFASLLANTTYRLKGIAPDGRLTAGGFTTNGGGSAKAQTLSFWEPAP